jgi:hypothetical protein
MTVPATERACVEAIAALAIPGVPGATASKFIVSDMQ